MPREFLTSNRTYYVRTDGSDEHGDGLTDEPARAFRTYQRAVDAARTLDFNNKTVTVIAGDEGAPKTFVENVRIKPLVGGGTLHIRGVRSERTRLASASGDTFTQIVSGDTQVLYSGMTLSSDVGNGIKVAYNSLAGIGNDMVFHSFGQNAIWVHDNQSVMQILNSDVYLTGSMASFLFIQYGHAFVEAATINLWGVPQWREAFVTMFPRGSLQYIGNVLQGPATPIGNRMSIKHLSLLNLNGASLSVLPGSADGVIDATSVRM